jgi:hypothetical protein
MQSPFTFNRPQPNLKAVTKRKMAAVQITVTSKKRKSSDESAVNRNLLEAEVRAKIQQAHGNILYRCRTFAPDVKVSLTLRSLFESENFSDCIVRCNEREWKVHRFIICPQAGLFKGALMGNFQVSLLSMPFNDPSSDTISGSKRWHDRPL